ncbi:hypothetical protein ANCCEY_02093 [Ancylostoma ceylanicum]|uniref:GRAM domain-containing protein n=1 Tax=Ancylostoma ceylanicum TaxID=53326 RepID=A0A0D6M3U6_9BILA|nr:hypothetical protein ANCCEY_02093 [Ancylostoma ceylanicum]
MLNSEPEPESLWSRLRNEARWFLYDIAEAFETQYEQPTQATTESQKLSAVALRRDLKRCYSFIHPLVEVAAALYDALLWKNPINTLLLALVYSYSIVRGWTASLVLLLLWTQLSLNYLKATKNIDIGLYFLPRKEVAMPKFDITGAQLIFDVAKIAQKLLNFAANFLEKLHSLLTWKDVRVTLVFYCLVIYWLTLSVIFNTGTCLGMCGLTLGVRIFITTYLFNRFPRLRKRLDTYGWFYRNLPVKTAREGSPVLISTADGVSIATKTGSMDCLSEQSSPISHPRAQWAAANGHLDNFDSAPVPLMNRPRAGISPLAAGAASPSPPQDPPPRERNSMETEEESVAESSSCMSFYSNDDEESVHEDPMIENVLAYRSCVMNDKERTFPKGISSGILYLTESALIYRAKSITDDRAPTIMLFADVISVKKVLHNLQLKLPFIH